MNWTEINTFLRNASEAESLTLLQEERRGQCRPLIISRIYCRYNKTRSQRERREMMTPLR